MLLALPLMLSIAVAQNQPSAPPKPDTKSDSAASGAEHIYGPKDHVKPPRVLLSPDPKYPKGTRKEGTVVLWLVVGSDGLTHDVKVQRSLSPDLDGAAIEAVKNWKFAPATKDGKPVAVQINVEVTFRL